MVALVVLGWAAWQLVGGGAGVVSAALPAFPDYPEPPERLAAGHAGTTHFPSHTPFDLDVLLAGDHAATTTTGIGELTLPAGASAEAPVPAMVILHGSGGIRDSRENAFARWFAARGIASLVVDYYAPRGFGDEERYMLRVVSVTEFDALADAYGALRLLSTHPAIDGERIGVIGFSYGGMAARFAMDERLRRALAPEHPGFAAFVDVYGPCFQQLGTRETNGAPLLTLRGTEDASNELSACAAREDELRAIGVEVAAEVYEGAGHAWEAHIPRAEASEAPYVTGCTMVYDERGMPFVDGQPVIDPAPGATRAERIALRVGSGTVMGACVKSGYIIGRDDETRARAEAAIEAFLTRALAL